MRPVIRQRVPLWHHALAHCTASKLVAARSSSGMRQPPQYPPYQSLPPPSAQCSADRERAGVAGVPSATRSVCKSRNALLWLNRRLQAFCPPRRLNHGHDKPKTNSRHDAERQVKKHSRRTLVVNMCLQPLQHWHVKAGALVHGARHQQEQCHCQLDAARQCGWNCLETC